MSTLSTLFAFYAINCCHWVRAALITAEDPAQEKWVMQQERLNKSLLILFSIVTNINSSRPVLHKEQQISQLQCF